MARGSELGQGNRNAEKSLSGKGTAEEIKPAITIIKRTRKRGKNMEINLETLKKWISKLSVEDINDFSDDQIMYLAQERPGHLGQYGFMLQLQYFKSEKHFAEIMHALMERLMKVENLKKKMEDAKMESEELRAKKHLEFIDKAMRLECKIDNKGNTGFWKIEGWDTFSAESYPLEGEYKDEETAREAARLRLIDLEKTQPIESSGGQDGIQDRIFVIGPDGSGYRFRES